MPIFEFGQQQCSVGGTYWYPEIPGPAVYEERCAAPVEYRYRSVDMVEGHWNYRCAAHARILDAPELIVEPLTPEQVGGTTRPQQPSAGTP